MFNFSATFTDPRDFVTCAFNFNLSKFVEEGYGKHIYLSQSNISAFKDKTDFSPIEKQKIVLKTLLLLTCINKYFKQIHNVNSSLYHRPLLLTLVNSVDVKQSDLELFFKELEKVAKNEIKSDLLEDAKRELETEFLGNNEFIFEELKCAIDTDLISELDYNDILKYVFNADTPGKIEVLKIPGNRQELIFRLMTAAKPFALIKIGDISSWLKDKLTGYEINESFENESYFRQINRDDSDINILMGSRSFYEGWDSNRPNLLLFVNIGIGSDSKKFVLQAVGRGVRIEPQKYQRKRLQNLYHSKIIDGQLFGEVKDLILPIESLFIFGTNTDNLKEIIATLKEEKQDKNLGEEFKLNPKAENYTLLIPVYKDSNRIFAEENDPKKYPISCDDLGITSKYFEFLGDKIALAKYDCEVNVLRKTKESFKQEGTYYDFYKQKSLSEPELILGRIFDYLGMRDREFDKLKKLENEIVHFKSVRFSDGDQYDEIIKKIDSIRQYPEKKKELEQNYGRITIEEYNKQLKLFDEAGKYEIKNQKIQIKYLANHYYLPLIVSETEKVDYINHIINVKSEIRFIEQLQEYLDKPNNVFTQFDWWMFSKLDQTLDEIFIPYYNSNRNKIANFKPDFIFWLQKDNRYWILFIDPKGTEYTDADRKIEGFSSIFEIDQPKKCKDFSYNGFTVNIKLLLKTDSIAKVPKSYKRYWFDNFNDFENKIMLS